MAASSEATRAPEAELTATQYVILAEAQRKKRALAETRVKYNVLVEENKRLLEEREHTERVTYEVTESMRREIFTKNEKLVKLESELQDQAAAYELQLSVLREEFGDKARKQRLSAQETEDKLQKEVDMLGKEIQEVEKFVHEKEELERARLRARADIEALNTKLEEMEAEHERRYIQGTMALKKGFEQKYDELKKRYEEDVDERLDASVKRILQQNRRTAQELQLHMDESSLLLKENQILLEERDKLLQELSIKVQLEERYVVRNAKQSRENKEANNKLIALEQTLQSFVEGFEKERQYMREQWTKASDNMKKEVATYRCLVDLKMKEAKNIRRLGQEVLLQRSDVETFFVSSLKYIREQIAQESLSEEPQMPMRSSPAGRGRDISELSWPDREQVLRLAFAKINSQARSTHFQSLPKHSFAKLQAARQRASDQFIPSDTLSGLVSEAGKPQLA